MLQERQLIAIFCEIDDFCKEFDNNISESLLSSPTKGRRGPNGYLSISEIMTVQILFQMVGYRNFKTFYTGFLQNYWLHYFPNLPVDGNVFFDDLFNEYTWISNQCNCLKNLYVTIKSWFFFLLF